jgi:hypothetical protein
MEITAIIMMIIILGTVWGGLLLTVNLAIKKERVKK